MTAVVTPIERSTRVRHPPRQFGKTPPLLPPGFADQLADHPRREDELYDARIGYLLAIASGWSYSDKETLENQLAYYGLENALVEQVSITNEAMLVVSTAFLIRSATGKTGILVFRGTEPRNVVNWLTDADVTWRDFSYGRVHAGFYANVQALWGDIREALQRATSPAEGGTTRQPMESLYITGHSLGAAMAAIAAARLVGEGQGWKELLRGVYTYGQPMVGDQAFKEYCDRELSKRVFRHVYRKDLVCRMPPRIVDQFVHFGEERFSASPLAPWTRDGKSRAVPPLFLTSALVSATLTFWARRIGVFRHLNLPYSMDDHLPTNYIQASRSTLVHI